MRTKKILFLFLILFITLIFQLEPHGFCAGTKVSVEQGLSTIEDLTVKDFVLSYDFKRGYSKQPIIAISKAKYSCCIRLWFNGTYLDTSPDQLFYLANEKRWVPAKKLTTQSILLKNIAEELTIDDIETIDQEVDLYILTVEKYHNFCVTEHAIHVHNIFPVVVVGAGIVFGGGVEFSGITVGICALGAFVGFKFLKDRKKPKLEFHDSHYQPSNQSHKNTINPTISINKPETPKKGCGGTQPSKDKDHILVTPATKPEQQPNKGCFNPAPLPTTKPGCGGIQPPKTTDLILNKDQKKDDPRLTQAGAPGVPGRVDGFIPPKKWDGKKVKHPETEQYGWVDRDGNYWVPTGPIGSPLAHGGPHWDVISKDGKKHKNVLPGGKEK